MHKVLSIIIPCYNEERTIRELLEKVVHADTHPWQKEIVVVDDGSSDGTRAILAEYRSKPGFRVIFRARNGGKGAAERDGIAAASGEYLFLQDADLEYDPRDIKKLIDVVVTTGAPIVFGSRAKGRTLWRREGLFFAGPGVWISTMFVNVLYGAKLTDAWTCYKLFSREVARNARFIGDGFEADYLFIGDAIQKGFPIVEVAIRYRPRSLGEGKKIRYADGIRAMVLLLKHRLGLLR